MSTTASVESYHKAIKDGVVKNLKHKILTILSNVSDMTNPEIVKYIEDRGWGTSDVRRVGSTLSVLYYDGKLDIVGERLQSNGHKSAIYHARSIPLTRLESLKRLLILKVNLINNTAIEINDIEAEIRELQNEPSRT